MFRSSSRGDNQGRNDQGVPITFISLGIESNGFDSSTESFASNNGFELAGLDLTLNGGSRENIRSGFSHYTGEPASRTPSQVNINDRRRFVILSGREVVYINNNFTSQDTEAVLAAINGATGGGPVDPPPTTFEVATASSPDSGGTVTSGGTVEEGMSISLTATPNPGYRFDSWNGIGLENPNALTTNLTVTQSQLVTAQFIKTWALSLEASPASGGSVSSGGTFDTGTTQTITATANEGYRFAGWTGEGIADARAASTTVTLNADTNATANFIKTWTLTVAANDTDGGSVSSGGTFDSGSQNAISATANEGYRFAGWTGEGIADASAASTTVTLNADTNATANFIKTWTLTVAANDTDGGSVSSGGTFDSGSQNAISATANEGYRFAGWTGEGIADASAASTTVTLNADTNATANFIKTWALTVAANDADGGSVSGEGSSTLARR